MARALKRGLPGSPESRSCRELERWIRTFDRSAVGAAYGKMNLHNVYANGQQVAGLDEAGKLDVISRLTAFSNSDTGSTQVTVQAGETLRGLAQRIYGNANLWYVIAEANALTDEAATLPAGITLTVPEVKTSSNDANTFKPYNPSEITGPTSPGLPYIEPPDKGCGTLGMIIMVIVIIVVSVYTAGAASGAAGAAGGAGAGASASTVAVGAGTAAGGAAAAGSAAVAGLGASVSVAGVTVSATSVWGAGIAAFAGGGGMMTAGTAMLSAGIGALAGSVAGQAVGSVMGVASFSWRNALVAGASSAATAGFGSLVQGGQLGATLQNTTWTRAAANAVVGNVTSYAAGRVVGSDVSFSWRSVAASAVSAAISTKLGESLHLSPTPDVGGTGSFWKDVGNGMIGGTIGLHTRRAFGFGDDINYRNIAADAFGNALGNAAVKGLDIALQAKEFLSSATSRQTEVFNQALEAGANKEQLLLAFRNNEFAEYIDKTGQADSLAQEHFDKRFDSLNAEDQAAIWEMLYRQGKVEVGAIDDQRPSIPNADHISAETIQSHHDSQEEIPSARNRIGRGAANLITDGTEKLETIVNWLGPKNAEAAAIGITIAAGGPVKAAGQFIFDQAIGSKLQSLKDQYIVQPLSDLVGRYIFDAGTAEELEIVKPASTPVSMLGANILLSALGFQGAKQGANEMVRAGDGFSLKREAAYQRIRDEKGRYASDPDSQKLPYSDARLKYGKGQVETVYESHKGPDGRVYDPNNPDVELPWDKSKPRNGQWDMGHMPEEEYRRLVQRYRSGEIGKDQFLREYRDPTKYRPELPSSNRGRMHESND